MPHSTRLLRTCMGCGKTERRLQKQKPKFFCNRECWLKRRRQLWAEQHPIDNKLRNKPCGVCGTEFTPNIHTYYKEKYCSNSCKQKAHRRQINAYYERNPAIKAQKHLERRIRTKWGGNWWNVLLRDNFTCRICGHIGDEREVRHRTIAVHHRDGEGERGECNHGMENLWTVCTTCHQAIHGISLRFKEGQWYVHGKIFALLNLVAPQVVSP